MESPEVAVIDVRTFYLLKRIPFNAPLFNYAHNNRSSTLLSETTTILSESATINHVYLNCIELLVVINKGQI